MIHRYPRLLSLGVVFFTGLFGFLLASHLLLNNPHIQKQLQIGADRWLGMKFSWGELRFTGLTGRFSGKNLSLEIPKSHLEFTLKEFNMVVAPLSLIFKKLHVIDLKADDIVIYIKELPERDLTGHKPTHRNLAPLLNNLRIDGAEINRLLINAPNDKSLYVGSLKVKTNIPLLIYSRGVDTIIENLAYRSDRFDLFTKQLEAKGSFIIKYTEGKNEPYLDGLLTFDSLLLGLQKAPTPWNPQPAWDDSLTPILLKYYQGNVPDNRTFVHFDNLDLPFQFDPETIQLKNAAAKVFDGEMEISALWEKKKGDANYSLTTKKPIHLSLLPLGKARFRHSFETADINLKGNGTFSRLDKGDLKGNLKVVLQKNLSVPEKDKLEISIPHHFKDGILQAPEIQIQLADGQAQGRGQIDLIKKTVQSSFNGKNFDTQTVVRFFSTIDIPGLADFTGEISGDLNNPTFNFALNSPETGYEKLNLGSFKGQLVIRDRNLKLTGNTVLAGTGNGRIDLDIAQVFRSSDQSVQLKIDFKNLPLGPLLRSEAISGGLSGAFNMTEEKQHYDGKGTLEAADIVWYKIPIQKITSTMVLKDKDLAFGGIQIALNSSDPPLVLSKPLVFHFSPEGYRFEGFLFPTAAIEGYRNLDDPDNLFFKIKATKTPLNFLGPLLPVEIDQFSTTGEFDITYHFPSPIDSKVAATLSVFEFTGEEKDIHLAARTQIDIENRQIIFRNSPFQIGTGRLILNGPLGFTDGSNLQVKGSLDLYQLTGILRWLVEGSGLVDVDLRVEGSINKPSYDGRLTFKNSELFFRDIKRDLTEVNGTLRLKGNRYEFDQFSLQYDEAPVLIDGWLEWTSPHITAANLNLRGTEIPFSKPDTWRLYTDANVSLTGSGDALRLSGKLNVTEGVYYKDYSLSQFVLRPVGAVQETDEPLVPEVFRDIRLNLNVKSTGEFEIRNNLADLTLKSDFDLSGTATTPQASGYIDIVEGQIHAFAIDFENATGFATFVPDQGLEPFIEFQASHEIQDFEIRAKIKGLTDNLKLSLEATPALNQTDIISLIAYGRTPDQLSPGDQSLFSKTAIASQIVGVLQRPISKATHLDIVRLEAEFGQKDPVLSRISVGKRISPRFSLAFTSDLTLDEALRGVQVEYEIFDNVLLKGLKDTGSRYRFDLTLRLQAY